MTDLKDRIRARLAEIRKPSRRASIDGGLNPDAIRNVLRSKSRNPRRDTLEGIARGLDWTLEELLELSSVGTAVQAHTSVRNVPLIGWRQAGAGIHTASSDLSGAAEAFVPVSHESNTLIALPVMDRTMNRIAPEASVIVVDFADKTFESGCYYVLKEGDRITCRRYRADPARLETDSTEAHQTVLIEDDTEVIGRVIQVINKLP